MRRFWWWDLLPQSQKFSWQCKVLYYCYFIWRPMLFVEKFQSRWSRCNFLFDSQDWVASKTQLCVRLLRSPSHRPMNPRLDLYIKQAHHCISLYWMGSIFTSAFDQFQIFFWFQKIKRTDCRTHYETVEGIFSWLKISLSLWRRRFWNGLILWRWSMFCLEIILKVISEDYTNGVYH